MARITGKALVHLLGGKIEGTIIRWRHGKVLISQAPDYSHRKWSRSQKHSRDRFREASKWARQNLERPEVMQYYRKLTRRGHAPYNRAISDYMKRLRVNIVNPGNYRGNPGDTITFRIPDPQHVAGVKVMIHDRKGALIDHGEAVRDMHGPEYSFSASVFNPRWKNGSVLITVFNAATSIPQYFSLS